MAPAVGLSAIKGMDIEMLRSRKTADLMSGMERKVKGRIS
jgi:hypothetical protein